jgi:hypothetical protein
MIGYLDRLEADLVEAVDRRNAVRARPWWRRPRRRRDVSLAVAAAAALLAIAAVVLIVRAGAGHERAVAPPPHVRHRPPPIPPRTPLRLVGNVARIGDTTWRGQARGPGGEGTLTLSGTVDLTPRPCCDTPRSRPRPSAHTVRFTWTSPSGTIGGAVRNTIYRRPHGRFVWDGLGRVVTATRVLGKYRGRQVGIAGVTTTSSPDRARIILEP